ncbi:MAG TPA: sigma-70 family RNA polymerase sigma factor [Planctomycetota bacterium]|nr:sigma-70 family RNA polymerase sigma factor [Planctomycetota bacterium]
MPPPFDVLLQIQRHGGALRELARVLLRDDADADDAVQETWARVLGSPPRHQERIGGWLAAILRNVAFRLRRSESRRVRHEERAAARAKLAAEDHAERIARADLAHRLIAAVDALDAPYRDVIWQRFFEGRAPRDIAAVSGVPPATVKSRLQRGLATLREQLGDREGSDWRAGLAATFGFGRDGTTAAAAAIAGGVLMVTWTKVTVAAFAAAVIAALVWWPDATAATPTEASRDARPLAASASADVGASHPDARIENDRTAAAGAANAPKLAVVRGRCVDANGAAIAACSVRLLGWHNGGWRDEDWILEHGIDCVEHAASTTADGRFEFAIEPPPPFQFALDVQGDGWAKGGFRWSAIEPGAVLDVGDLTMLPGVALRGRIVDAAGQPVGDVRLDANAVSQVRSKGFEPCSFAGGRTAADGTFTFDASLAHGSYTLRVTDDYVVKSPVPLVLTADSASGVRVVVTRDDVPTITGTVVDGAGMPVRYPLITTNGVGEPVAKYGKQDGTFELRCNSGDATRPVRIAVRAEGYKPAQHGDELCWGTRDVRVQLKRGAPDLTMLVRDRGGRPLEGCTLRLHALGSPSSDGIHAARTRSDANGVATIANLESGEYLVIAQFAASRGLPATIEPVVFDGSPARLELRIGAQPSRRLRVQRRDGTPVAGTRVQLCEMLGNSFGSVHQVLAPRNWFVTNSTAPRILALVDAMTDADGTLLVSGPGNRDLGLRVLGPGHVAVERTDVRFDTAADLVVTVVTGARVHGTIAPAAAVDALHRLAGVAAGEPFPAARRPFIQLRRDKELVPPWSRGAGDRQPFAINDDGSFDVSGLPDGQWQVYLGFWVKSASMTMSQDALLAECVLADGVSKEIATDLSALVTGTIRGLVLRNGEPWPDRSFSVRVTRVGPDGKEQQESMIVGTDANGRFDLVNRAGRYELHGPGDSVATPAVDMVRGEVVSATFEFVLGELSVRLLTPDGSPAANVELLDATTDADGRMKVLLRPQSVTLRLLPRRLSSRDARRQVRAEHAGGDPFAGHWIELGQATVAAGKTTTLELRLPPEWEK